jgi:uncharacterized membrane protein YeaQ/YmgE (transglycosylase-associated protein family)
MRDRLKKEQHRSVFVLIVFGVLAASLSTVVFPFAEKSLEWVGFVGATVGPHVRIDP